MPWQPSFWTVSFLAMASQKCLLLRPMPLWAPVEIAMVAWFRSLDIGRAHLPLLLYLFEDGNRLPDPVDGGPVLALGAGVAVLVQE